MVSRKRLGQHFLTDPLVIDRIVSSADFKQSDQLIEIGPGLGALTLPLLKQLGTLTVIEYDGKLIPELKQKSENIGSLNVYHQDVLRFDFTKAARGKKIRLMGNLPYCITSPLLFHIIRHIDVIEDMHFMVQREVADRLAATPAETHYSRLSVMMGYYCKTRVLFSVDPVAFSPPPRVYSSVVRLVPNRARSLGQLSSAHRCAFEHIVRLAFHQRRKMISNTLGSVISLQRLEALGVDPKARAETLSIETFIQIAHAVNSMGNVINDPVKRG